jgi:hypothetical protein
MNKVEGAIALAASITGVISLSNLQAPRQCQVIWQGETPAIYSPPPDKTAGIVAAIGFVALGVMGARSLKNPETTLPSATNIQSQRLGPSNLPAITQDSNQENVENIQPQNKNSSIEFESEKHQELWRKLTSPGYEWLLQLLLTKPLLVWGEQCSGKTQFSSFLAMLRMLFFKHKVSVADPHSHQNEWPSSFEVYGASYNYGQVNNRLTAYYQRLKNGNMPHTSIWDEVTNYQECCDEKLAGRFLKSILSDVRKPPEFPILLSHSNTLSSLGGGKGGVKTMQVRGLVEVNLRAKRDELGNLKPALKGSITGLQLDEKGDAITQQIELEPWMQYSWLEREFGEISKMPELNVEKQQLETAWNQQEKQRVKQLAKEGFTQTEIIKEVWGVSPGESSRYQDAVEKFKTYNIEED